MHILNVKISNVLISWTKFSLEMFYQRLGYCEAYLMKSVNLLREKNLPEEATIRMWRNRAKSRGSQEPFMFPDLFLFITNCPMSFSLFLFYANASFYCSDDISPSKVVSSNKQREIGFRPDYQDKSLPKPSPRFFFWEREIWDQSGFPQLKQI